MDAFEDMQYMDLKGMFFGLNRFILKIQDDSMLGDHICNFGPFTGWNRLIFTFLVSKAKRILSL